MGACSAGRNASSVGAPELAAFVVEPDPVSGASLWHAPSTRHKSKQTATVPRDCHRLLGAAAAHRNVGVGGRISVRVCEAGPRVIRRSVHARVVWLDDAPGSAGDLAARLDGADVPYRVVRTVFGRGPGGGRASIELQYHVAEVVVGAAVRILERRPV